MEYLSELLDILEYGMSWALDEAEALNNLSDIFAYVAGGVFVIKGLNYIKTLREKKATAIFGFWNHLTVKLIMIKNRLSQEPSIINNLYSVEIRESWQNRGAPAQEEHVNDFKLIVSETLNLIKSEEDQLPAYKGWTADYIKLIEFLDDISHFDITKSNDRFKFTNKDISIGDRDKYCKDICDTIEKIVTGIKKTQKKAEKKLY